MFNAMIGMRQQRGYATLKDIQLRLKAIKNIGKITNSMKMIASTKLNRAQKSMEQGRLFGRTTQNVLEHLGMIPTGGIDYRTSLEVSLAELKGNSNIDSPKYLFLACSSDRGLCGSIHSSVSKTARRLAGQDRSNVNIVVLGDKAKPQISRDSRQNIVMHFNQVGKNIPTFLDALVIWEYVSALKREQETPFSHCGLIYNRFVTAISFETVLALLPEVTSIKKSEKLGLYECESSVLENFTQYLGVSRLYWALVEGHAAEMSSKRTAMENATKNAEAIVIDLTMKYNRTRQAVITNELVDIITGASAL